MFNFLKSLFAKNSPSQFFGMGSLESPADSRNIALSSFQKPIAIPNEFETELPPVENQENTNKCVGYAIHKVAELYITKSRVREDSRQWIDLSPDDLYAQCKFEDGIPDMPGTYPSIGAKVLTKYGVATTEAYQSGNTETIRASRAANKLPGYAFVEINFQAICQAIHQNGAICASFTVDSNWFIGKITHVLKSLGRHYIVLKGYNFSARTLKAQNSWGTGWIGYIAGIFSPSVKSGCLEVAWDDVYDSIGDIIVFTQIPEKILYEVKNIGYRFHTTMRLGMTGFEVKKLQDKLNIVPATGYFGPFTQKKVIEFQMANNLPAEGVVGPLTREKLNIGTKVFNIDDIKKIIMRVAKEQGIEPELALAVCQYEGGFDPECIHENKNAAGKTTSIDKGLYQWNDKFHPEITETMAFDPEVSTRLFCEAVKRGELHTNWSASEPNWKKVLSYPILKKYGVA